MPPEANRALGAGKVWKPVSGDSHQWFRDSIIKVTDYETISDEELIEQWQNSPPSRYRWVAAVLAVAGCAVIASCTYSSWTSLQKRLRKTQCKNNLKEIGIAIHRYHDSFGAFPPAVVVREDGQPLHSWRTLVIPFIDAQMRHDWPLIQKTLHTEYSFDDPWNGPSNLALADEVPRSRSGTVDGYFRCWQDTADECNTSYLAVVGPNTVWANDQTTSLDNIPSPSETIVVVEVADSGIRWSEPKDLSINEVSDKSGAAQHGGGAHVLMADGSVRFYSRETVQSPDFRKMFLIDKDDSH